MLTRCQSNPMMTTTTKTTSRAATIARILGNMGRTRGPSRTHWRMVFRMFGSSRNGPDTAMVEQMLLLAGNLTDKIK